jgi:2-oxoglutarate dehydrogenase E1 component
MSNLTEFFGPNAGYVLDLYDRYRSDPSSVDDTTRALFERWTPSGEVSPPSVPLSKPTEAGTAAPDFDKVVDAARVARRVRHWGHKTAHIDPLGSEPPGDPLMELTTYGLTPADLAAMPADVVGGRLSEGAANALEALGRLRRAYSGSIGYEDDHVQNAEERDWLRDAAESGRFFDNITDTDKRELLARLSEVEGFEQFLQKTFGPAKRFSIEGTDMLVPMLDTIIDEAAQVGTREVVMGMAHRGRLNVLAHILGKPYAAILEEFQHSHQEEDHAVAGGGTHGYSGDVKYHLGARRAYSDDGQRVMPITLAPNPSHLEFVNPVVVGRARAAQERRSQRGAPIQDPKASLAIQIHGDAAFPGQGIVAETLNMSRLPGYAVGGSIHIIVNNQIGFTTIPIDDRSTLYASDLAKGFEIPIIHVNADDPVACIAAARMAHAYREQFGKDFLVDLVGYRRFGHNEGDDPSFTQPRMYEIITKHPTVRDLLARRLEKAGVVTRDEAAAMVATVQDKLQKARVAQPGFPLQKTPASLSSSATSAVPVPEERLRRLNDEMLARPAGFTANAKLETILGRRRTGMDKPNGIDWAHAESLAYASILEDGTPIRLTGQDSQRGTFGVRHSVLHDPTNGETYTPLQNITDAHASFAVYNSSLSENAVLGFEYGYSIHATEALVLWEAQFGDFSNGAQVIIDQFLVSGNAKWQQTPSLVMLLPHGYEGAGPEHSSARLERYLQLAANDNIQVVNCTSSGQYFHLLRRQAAQLQTLPRPLIVMTPKSLLREPLAGSSLADLAQGTFQTVIDDAQARQRADQVTRLVFCTGKVYVDLIKNFNAKEGGIDPRLAVARLEQLYPFPKEAIQEVVAGYPNLREVVWMQEEPRNMGAWRFLSTRLREIVSTKIPVEYVGRPESASPAEGSGPRHTAEQTRILNAVQEGLPAAKPHTNGNGSSNGKADTGEPLASKSLSKRSGVPDAR